MSKTMIAIIFLIIGSAITESINIIFAPCKNWAFNKTKDSCKFIFPYQPLTGTYRDIEITKRFGKTIHISCPWFRKREQRKINNKTYLYCPFGEGENKGGKCPFC